MLGWTLLTRVNPRLPGRGPACIYEYVSGARTNALGGSLHLNVKGRWQRSPRVLLLRVMWRRPFICCVWQTPQLSSGGRRRSPAHPLLLWGSSWLSLKILTGPQQRSSKPPFISSAARLTEASTATLHPTALCLHSCRASDEKPPPRGADFLDLNGNVGAPVASSREGPELQSCQGAAEAAAEASGLRQREAQRCVTQSRCRRS